MDTVTGRGVWIRKLISTCELYTWFHSLTRGCQIPYDDCDYQEKRLNSFL